MQRKQLEQQRVTTILRDARVITDAMVQKQRDAQQSKLVVSATGDQYVSNARYVLFFCVLSLSVLMLTQNTQIHADQQRPGPQDQGVPWHARPDAGRVRRLLEPGGEV